MEIISNSLNLIASLVFIWITHHLLITIFDWSKIIRSSQENIRQLRLFLLLISIAIGYLVSRFVIDMISLSQALFYTVK